MSGNGEFLLNNWLSLCPSVIPSEKDSKKYGVRLACQISENHDKNNASNQTGGMLCRALESDDDLIQYPLQTVFVIDPTDSFHAFYSLSAKVI